MRQWLRISIALIQKPSLIPKPRGYGIFVSSEIPALIPP